MSSGAGEKKAELRAALDASDLARARALLDARPALVAARFAPNNDTPLHLAVAANQAGLVELLLERGAAVGALNSWRGSPLMSALIRGYGALAALLVRHGAPTRTLDEAAGLGDVESMRAFWDESGALRQNAASRFGQEIAPGVWEAQPRAPLDEREVLHSALEYACRNGRLAAAGLMLERGASINDAGFFGPQPLHWAAGNGHDEMVRFLVERGADLRARSEIPRYPLRLGARIRARFDDEPPARARLRARGARTLARPRQPVSFFTAAIRMCSLKGLMIQPRAPAFLARATAEASPSAVNISTGNAFETISSDSDSSMSSPF